MTGCRIVSKLHLLRLMAMTPPATSTAPPQVRTPQPNDAYRSPQPQVQREPVITARGSEAVRSSSTEAPRRTQQPVDSELGISFAVQLAASPQPLDATQPQWHNLGFLIEIVEEDRMFKYQARNFQTWASAFQAKLLLQQKGFPDAFIVAYQRGQRIPMQDARQQLGME